MPTFILLRNKLISSLSKLTGRRVTDWKFQFVQNRRCTQGASVDECVGVMSIPSSPAGLTVTRNSASQKLSEASPAAVISEVKRLRNRVSQWRWNDVGGCVSVSKGREN